MDKNRLVKIGTLILIIILLVVLLILIMIKINDLDKNNTNNTGDIVDKVEDDNSNKHEENLNNNNNFNENEEDLEEGADDGRQEFLTQLTEFKDDFEKAMFVYGWFYGAETLMPYIDYDNKIEQHYMLLKIENFKTIQDMKNYAYEVFDKSFIDSKFKENTTGDKISFKENEDGIWILLDAAQYSYNTGYTNYDKVVNNDGTISYKVNIKAELMGEEYGCDTLYEYKMEKNNEGKNVFKSFESPINICIKDANSN